MRRFCVLMFPVVMSAVNDAFAAFIDLIWRQADGIVYTDIPNEISLECQNSSIAERDLFRMLFYCSLGFSIRL